MTNTVHKSASASPLSDSHQPHKREYISNPFTVLVRGTERLFKTNQTAVIVLVVVSVVLGIFQVFIELIRAGLGAISSDSPSTSSSTVSTNSDPSINAAAVATILIVFFVVIGIFLLISTVWNILYKGALAYIAACTVQNQKASFSEGASVIGKKFWQLLIASVIIQLKVFGGLLLLVIPGIRAMLRYDLVMILIIDKDLKAMQAMRAMKDITKGRLIEIFGVKTLASFVPLVSSVIELGGQVEQYEQLTMSFNNPAMKRTNVHWLNYIGLILFGAFMLLLVFIGMVIAFSTTLF